MGCASSNEYAECLEGADATHVIDLALCPLLTDAAASDFAKKFPNLERPPVALRSPAWARHHAPLTGAGLKVLCNGAYASLQEVHVNESALPRVTPDAVADSLALLPNVEEVTLRGVNLPRAALSRLVAVKPRGCPALSVALCGQGIDQETVAFIPAAFPKLERLCLGDLSPAVRWSCLFIALQRAGARLPFLTALTLSVDIDENAVAAIREMCPEIEDIVVNEPWRPDPRRHSTVSNGTARLQLSGGLVGGGQLGEFHQTRLHMAHRQSRDNNGSSMPSFFTASTPEWLSTGRSRTTADIAGLSGKRSTDHRDPGTSSDAVNPLTSPSRVLSPQQSNRDTSRFTHGHSARSGRPFDGHFGDFGADTNGTDPTRRFPHDGDHSRQPGPAGVPPHRGDGVSVLQSVMGVQHSARSRGFTPPSPRSRAPRDSARGDMGRAGASAVTDLNDLMSVSAGTARQSRGLPRSRALSISQRPASSVTGMGQVSLIGGATSGWFGGGVGDGDGADNAGSGRDMPSRPRDVAPASSTAIAPATMQNPNPVAQPTNMESPGVAVNPLDPCALQEVFPPPQATQTWTIPSSAGQGDRLTPETGTRDAIVSSSASRSQSQSPRRPPSHSLSHPHSHQQPKSPQHEGHLASNYSSEQGNAGFLCSDVSNRPIVASSSLQEGLPETGGGQTEDDELYDDAQVDVGGGSAAFDAEVENVRSKSPSPAEGGRVDAISPERRRGNDDHNDTSTEQSRPLSRSAATEPSSPSPAAAACIEGVVPGMARSPAGAGGPHESLDDGVPPYVVLQRVDVPDVPNGSVSEAAPRMGKLSESVDSPTAVAQVLSSMVAIATGLKPALGGGGGSPLRQETATLAPTTTRLTSGRVTGSRGNTARGDTSTKHDDHVNEDSMLQGDRHGANDNEDDDERHCPQHCPTFQSSRPFANRALLDAEEDVKDLPHHQPCQQALPVRGGPMPSLGEHVRNAQEHPQYQQGDHDPSAAAAAFKQTINDWIDRCAAAHSAAVYRQALHSDTAGGAGFAGVGRGNSAGGATGAAGVTSPQRNELGRQLSCVGKDDDGVGALPATPYQWKGSGRWESDETRDGFLRRSPASVQARSDPNLSLSAGNTLGSRFGGAFAGVHKSVSPLHALQPTGPATGAPGPGCPPRGADQLITDAGQPQQQPQQQHGNHSAHPPLDPSRRRVTQPARLIPSLPPQRLLPELTVENLRHAAAWPGDVGEWVDHCSHAVPPNSTVALPVQPCE